jgi:translocation and assembly module TamB
VTSPSLSPDPGNEMRHRSLWTRVVLWVTGGIGFVLLLLILGVVALLHNAGFHRYLLRKADQIASQRIGTPVTLQNFSIHLSNLNLDLYGLTVDGAAPHSDPPLLRVQHIGLNFRVVSVWHRKWYFDDIRVDKPVARIFTDAQGISNLPTLKSSGGTHTNIFELGVRHASLQGGELYENDKKIPLDAELHDVNFSSSFNFASQEYSGSLSYQDGQLQFGSFNPIPHNLRTQFRATPNVFYLTDAKIDSGSSQVDATATLSDYSNPTIHAHYDAVLDGTTIRLILKNPAIPSGSIVTNGSVQYQHSSHLPLLDSLTVDGALTSRHLDVHEKQIRTQVRNIAAHYSLQNGNLSIQQVRANLLGGAADGDLVIHDIGGNSHSVLRLSLRGISVADARRLAPQNAALKDVSLGGVVNATAEARWGNTLNDLVAQTTLSIRGNVSSVATEQHTPNVLPITGVILGSYAAAH